MSEFGATCARIAKKYCLTAAIGVAALFVGFVSGFLAFGSEPPPEQEPIAVETVETRETFETFEDILPEDEAAGVYEDFAPPSEARYIISVFEGKVAVFIETEGGAALNRLTEKPVSALTENERVRLENGIIAVGDSELMSLLQDYDL